MMLSSNDFLSFRQVFSATRGKNCNVKSLKKPLTSAGSFPGRQTEFLQQSPCPCKKASQIWWWYCVYMYAIPSRFFLPATKSTTGTSCYRAHIHVYIFCTVIVADCTNSCMHQHCIEASQTFLLVSCRTVDDGVWGEKERRWKLPRGFDWTE